MNGIFDVISVIFDIREVWENQLTVYLPDIVYIRFIVNQ